MTYEFQIRVGDGFRWSGWSQATDPCCFALQPRIVKDVPVRTDDLHKILQPNKGTVAAAVPVDPYREPLSTQLAYSSEGDMEPPLWVSIETAPTTKRQSNDPAWRSEMDRDAQVSQFVVNW